MHNRMYSGFTLIELMVVVSIITLLSTFVLASLSEARKSAQDAVTIQSVKQFETAVMSYSLDHDSYPQAIVGGFTIIDPSGTLLIAELKNGNYIPSSVTPESSHMVLFTSKPTVFNPAQAAFELTLNLIFSFCTAQPNPQAVIGFFLNKPSSGFPQGAGMHYICFYGK